MIDIGLYIHIPFCVSKCNYCDFTSFQVNQDIKSKYLKSLIEEIALYKDNNYRVKTIFIGGGTPSILNYNELSEIIGAIHKSFVIDCKELTIESNPESLCEEKLKLYRSFGIDRLSIGVQSFDDNTLKLLGRAHNSYQASIAIELAKKYFSNINVDLMTGLPNESDTDGIESINKLISYNIPHVSLYSLMLEQGTPLQFEVNNNNLCLPNDDKVMDRFNVMCDLLEANGLSRYEISNFSKQGSECKHNLRYWTREEYIGLGLSAHSFINSKRQANTSDINDYSVIVSKGLRPIVESDRIDELEAEFEHIMLSLRLTCGINLYKFNSLFKKDFLKAYSIQIDKLRDFMNINDVYVSIRKENLGILNSILTEFMQ